MWLLPAFCCCSSGKLNFLSITCCRMWATRLRTSTSLIFSYHLMPTILYAITRIKRHRYVLVFIYSVPVSLAFNSVTLNRHDVVLMTFNWQCILIALRVQCFWKPSIVPAAFAILSIYLWNRHYNNSTDPKYTNSPTFSIFSSPASTANAISSVTNVIAFVNCD